MKISLNGLDVSEPFDGHLIAPTLQFWILFSRHLNNVVYQQKNENLEEMRQNIINEINHFNQEPQIISVSLERLKRCY